MCQEIFAVSVGTGVVFSFTISFTSIIVKYSVFFLNWWKQSKKCKYTFLISGCWFGVSLGKAGKCCYQDSVEEKIIKNHSFVIHESILFHHKLGGNFHWNSRNKLETRWKGVKVTFWAPWSLFWVINVQTGRRQWRMAWKHILQKCIF